ncbi:hypothetical protein GAYE_SCF43G5688 [Galdieria yellowstonensis]|jgi:membrane associated rhomboid family serine protease|uniref:Rhomboid family protein n=1 Tax=Galdieria yellowstonensis TaxID=3028027 RepID=A0AAV9IK28_9RHOD|nr:hypothetical protein GAYE_SCF43G5688 [Galdieria yellowstonensis]
MTTRWLLDKIPPLSRILLLIFIFGSFCVWWFSLEPYVLLVPGLTISRFYIWNVLTYSLVDVPLWEMGLLVAPLGFLYSMLERSWGVVPLLLFIGFVSLSSACSSILLLVVLYTWKRDETLLYVPLSGSMAILGGLLVAVKQLIPEHEIYILPRRFGFRILVNDMPFWFLLVCVSSSWLMKSVWIGPWWLLPLFGVWNSWLYLRYIQKREYGRGDRSDSFRLYTLLPMKVGGRWWWIRNKRDENTSASHRQENYPNDILPVTTTDPTEAERRRQRALRALDERLGNLKTTKDEAEMV